jgi:hypothetical protein
MVDRRYAPLLGFCVTVADGSALSGFYANGQPAHCAGATATTDWLKEIEN